MGDLVALIVITTQNVVTMVAQHVIVIYLVPRETVFVPVPN